MSELQHILQRQKTILTLPLLLLHSPMRFGFSSSYSGGDTAPGRLATASRSPFGVSSFGISSVSTTASPSPFGVSSFGISSVSTTASPSPFEISSVSTTASPSPFGVSSVSTTASSDTVTSTMPPKTSVFFNFPPMRSSTVSSVSEKPCDFISSASASSSPAAGDSAPPWLIGATAASTDTATMPWFTNAISSATTSANTTSLTVSHIPPSDSLLSVTSLSSVSAQPQSTVSAPEFVTVPACSLEKDEVAAILASKCEKFLSYRAARRAAQNERHDSVAKPWDCVTMGFETTSSNKPFGDSAHTPAAIAEQNYGESKLCCVPMSGAPSTSTPSVLLGSKSGSSLFPSSQPAEKEQPYFPPVDLMHSTIDMWKRVVANKKTDQEVIDEGLRHFYEGINYFCLLSERLQVATDKYNEAAKARDDMEKMNSSLKDKLAEASRKVEDSKKEKERLEHELTGAANKVTALTAEKESILRIQTILHQTISELRRELEEAGPAAIQKYKASSLYRQELMEYAAPYMGEGVKLAIEKIKAKDPTFDPETYGLEMYILPPEGDDQESS